MNPNFANLPPHQKLEKTHIGKPETHPEDADEGGTVALFNRRGLTFYSTLAKVARVQQIG